MRRAEGRKEGRVRQYNKGKRGGEEPRGKCKAEKGHGHMGVGGDRTSMLYLSHTYEELTCTEDL